VPESHSIDGPAPRLFIPSGWNGVPHDRGVVWKRVSRTCGRCGGALVDIPGSFRDKCTCRKVSTFVHARWDPSVETQPSEDTVLQRQSDALHRRAGIIPLVSYHEGREEIPPQPPRAGFGAPLRSSSSLPAIRVLEPAPVSARAYKPEWETPCYFGPAGNSACSAHRILTTGGVPLPINYKHWDFAPEPVCNNFVLNVALRPAPEPVPIVAAPVSSPQEPARVSPKSPQGFSDVVLRWAFGENVPDL